LRVRRVAKNHAAARTAQRLMRGRGHYPRVRIRMRVRARDDEPRDVRDVRDERRADRLGDLREARVVPNARIRRAAAENELWLRRARERLDAIQVDAMRLRIDVVL